ncbi:phosphotransferase family protein [[Mycoplasma] collis]|uniref:phosphotransferase family protein n=1 Tax=[Mycoplasma] collis TaxID=2127 RepID=UPI00051B6FA0|nr:hypothetical protein [[Mycoplasma] collis]
MNFLNELPEKLREKLKDINLYYKGFHNETYTAYYENIKVQIRVAINEIAKHQDEINFIKKNKDYFYFTDKILIKKWYDGDILQIDSLTKEDSYKILDKMKKLWKNKEKFSKINWFYYKIDDLKYIKLIKKYKNDFTHTIHGDIRPKNIIKTNNNEIVLIDYEWIRKGSKYFDISSFLKFSKLSKQEVIDYLNLSSKKLENYIYITNLFNKHAYYEVYDKMKDYYIGEIKK